MIFFFFKFSIFFLQFYDEYIPYHFEFIMQINAGITTQLLLSTFDIEGVVHYGIAGNANPSLNIGDVTIPQYWAHTALWNWQVVVTTF